MEGYTFARIEKLFFSGDELNHHFNMMQIKDVLLAWIHISMLSVEEGWESDVKKTVLDHISWRVQIWSIKCGWEPFKTEAIDMSKGEGPAWWLEGKFWYRQRDGFIIEFTENTITNIVIE